MTLVLVHLQAGKVPLRRAISFWVSSLAAAEFVLFFGRPPEAPGVVLFLVRCALDPRAPAGASGAFSLPAMVILLTLADV